MNKLKALLIMKEGGVKKLTMTLHPQMRKGGSYTVTKFKVRYAGDS